MESRNQNGSMSKEQAESSGAIQSKLDVFLGNSIAHDKLVVDKPSGTRVDFVEPQRKKQNYTPLHRIDSTMASGGTRTAMKGEPQTQRGYQRTQEYMRVYQLMP